MTAAKSRRGVKKKKPAKGKQRGEVPAEDRPLTPKQARFVELFLISLNALQAYRDAFQCSLQCAKGHANRVLALPHVAKAIAAAKAERAERAGVTADDVFRRLWSIATADPRELIEYRRTCCRYCHGKDFRYHFTKAELARARNSWEEAQKKNSTAVFDEHGGDGYWATKEPHPACPECFGEGIERVFVHDTRRLSDAALTLYAGVKVTKDGIEVKMHDQGAHLVNVGKHLGMFQEKPESPMSESERIARLRAALSEMDSLTLGKAA